MIILYPHQMSVEYQGKYFYKDQRRVSFIKKQSLIERCPPKKECNPMKSHMEKGIQLNVNNIIWALHLTCVSALDI